MTKAKSYQVMQQELDDILAKLQQPDVDVDEALKLYEEGSKLTVLLEKHLELAEHTLEKLQLQHGGGDTSSV